MKYALLFTLLFSGISHANDCAKDIMKYCRGVDPEAGLLAKCLKDNHKKLSKPCLKEIQKAVKK